VLSLYQFPVGPNWALPLAMGLFIFAAITDALDGALARRWQVVSVFGRIVDPFADKMLVLGAFLMLAGPGFALFRGWGNLNNPPHRADVLVHQMSGVMPWMVVVILGREFLVTTIRAVLEGRGIDFSASWTGKAKMIVQAVGIPVIIGMVMFVESDAYRWLSFPSEVPRPDLTVEARIADTTAWIITAVTVVSAVPYITRAMSVFRRQPLSETA
jgi:CDP-diacylglycerol--glycerol-3-phosphate 3-phosphatidyltransferase